MKDIEIASKQLEQFYTVIEQEEQRIVEIRKWAITVWLAIIISIASNKIIVIEIVESLIVLLPVVMFWLLEGQQQMWMIIDGQKAKQIEEFIAGYKTGQKLPLVYFYASSYGSFSYQQKIKLYLKALFLTERLFLFYLLVLVISILCIIIF